MVTDEEFRRSCLKRLVDRFGWGGIARLARELGVEPSYVSRMLADPSTRQRRPITGEMVIAISKLYPDWLSPSSDTTESATLAYSRSDASQQKAKGEVEIRKYDTGGSMGNGVLLRDQPGVIQSWRVSLDWIEKNVRNHTGVQNLSIVTGFGDSMRPMFEPGDPLILDAGVKSVDFDGVYFFRVENEGFIKRLQRIPGEGLRAISENKAYESWTIKPGMDFEVFGRILKAWKSEDY